eukprot:PhM_4_TR1172/c0_g1_i1/m.103825
MSVATSARRYPVAASASDAKRPSSGATAARSEWFHADAYPNWTLSSTSLLPQKKSATTKPRTPTTLQTVPEERRRSPSATRRTNAVDDIEGATRTTPRRRDGPRDTNWTIPNTPKDALTCKPSYANNTVDIEGSRPALTKFRKCNQRIVPDPYPGHAAGPRRNNSHAATRFSDEGFVGSESSYIKPGHPHNQGNSLQLKRIEVFKNGHYVVQNVVMDNAVSPHRIGLHESKGTRTDDISKPRRSPSANSSKLSLRTDDIDGARPTGRRVYNHPNLSLNVSDINTVTSHRGRSTSPATRGEKTNFSLTTADIDGASPRTRSSSSSALRKTPSMCLSTKDIPGAQPRVATNRRDPNATTTQWW